MRKLSEIQNEDALDVLCDLFDPVFAIVKDPNVLDCIKMKDRGTAVKVAIKNHKKSVLSILAILEGVPLSEYKVSLAELPVKVYEILNDQVLLDFFVSQGLMNSNASSGSAMESSGETVNE